MVSRNIKASTTDLVCRSEVAKWNIKASTTDLVCRSEMAKWNIKASTTDLVCRSEMAKWLHLLPVKFKMAGTAMINIHYKSNKKRIFAVLDA